MPRSHLRQPINRETEQETLHKNNKIMLSKQYIIINGSQLSFSRFSPQTKLILIHSLKQCSDKKIMKEVFHRWQDTAHQTKVPKKLFLGEEDGIQLIWRMQKMLERNKTTELMMDLRNQIDTLKQQFISYEKSLVKMTQKKLELTMTNFSKDKQQQKKELASKMNAFTADMQAKMASLEVRIYQKREELDKRKNEVSLDFQNPAMSAILSKAINKEVRDLLRESILFIVEITRQIILEEDTDKQEAYVVFEQTYPTKKIKKKDIVKILGSQAYLEKVQKFRNFLAFRDSLPDEERQRTNSMFCCHRCLRLCSTPLLNFCTKSITHAQTDSYPSTDYFSFRKTHLEGDYLYDVTTQHVLPFFEYNKSKNNYYCCNRAICQNCLNSFKIQRDSCLYCQGLCNCNRCERAYGVVKLIALDYKNDPLQKKSYHETLKLFGTMNHPSVSDTFSLRVHNDESEFKFLKKVWVKCNSSPRNRVDIPLPLKQPEST